MMQALLALWFTVTLVLVVTLSLNDEVSELGKLSVLVLWPLLVAAFLAAEFLESVVEVLEKKHGP